MYACVTGYGIIDALGASPEECYANYMSDSVPVSKIKTRTEIDTFFGVDEDKIILPSSVARNRISKQTALSLHTAKQACEMAGITSSSNTAVIFASGVPTDSYEEHFLNYYTSQGKRVGPRKFIDTISGSTSYAISSLFGFTGARTANHAACTTGIYSIDYAIRCLEEYDHVVVGTSEIVTETTIHLFESLRALSNNSMPFDQHRSGFVAGEGSGCLVLESEKKARARNARVYARVYLPGLASDDEGDTLPNPDGKGAIAAMRKAIDNAGIQFSDVDFVNAHATSTPAGDEVEYRAVRGVTEAPVYSCKGKIGHLLTSCNINEIIYSILFSQKSHSGFNTNLTTPIYQSHHLPTSPVYVNKTSIVTLKNSFGFGGRCASLIITVHP